MRKLTGSWALGLALTWGALACGSAASSIDPEAPPLGEDGAPSDAGSTPGVDAAVPPGGDGSALAPGPDDIAVMVEPSDKAQALLTAVQGAKSSIHMTMYLMNDKRFIAALIAQHAAGRDVKVVLNQTFPGGAGSNQSTFSQLQSAGVAVVWAPSTFTLTHEKCVLIDSVQAWIMTMNLESSSSTNREYLAIDNSKADVAEAEAIFAADFASAPVTPTGSLLVAPVNARPTLLALIQSAKKTLDLEGEELSDTKIVAALIAVKQAGVAVRVVLADNAPSASQASAVAQLKAASIPAVRLATPYVHAKALVVDGARAYVGSENFTTASLQYNRELGITTSFAASVSTIATTIAKDFGAGTAL